MEHGLNSKRTTDGDTAQMQTKRKKTRWQYRTDGCPKQAQTGCKSLCKQCYQSALQSQPQSDSTQGAENKLNTPRSDSTQRPENLAILGNSSSNNANVSLQRGTTSFHGCVSIPSMAYVASLEKKINDMETQNLYLDRRISYLEELMRNCSSPMFQSHSFNSVQDSFQ